MLARILHLQKSRGIITIQDQVGTKLQVWCNKLNEQVFWFDKAAYYGLASTTSYSGENWIEPLPLFHRIWDTVSCDQPESIQNVHNGKET